MELKNYFDNWVRTTEDGSVVFKQFEYEEFVAHLEELLELKRYQVLSEVSRARKILEILDTEGAKDADDSTPDISWGAVSYAHRVLDNQSKTSSKAVEIKRYLKDRGIKASVTSKKSASERSFYDASKTVHVKIKNTLDQWTEKSLERELHWLADWDTKRILVERNDGSLAFEI